MAALNTLCLQLLLFSSLCISISGGLKVEDFLHKSFKYSSHGRKLLDDSINPTPTTFPSNTPITNPANFPPYTPTPTVVTIPASNPTSVTPTTPSPFLTPSTSVPITNPAATYPTPAGNIPAGNIPAGNIPATNPPTQTNAPVIPGQTWCIAKTGVPESALQTALDYACGIGGADCSMIQQGASCYNPNSIENHASYAFNSYFQKNPAPNSCDFGGTATLVNTNPSVGSCIYPSSATTTTTAMPASMNPPSTTSSSGATGFTPGAGGYGYGSPTSAYNPAIYGPDSPPTGNSEPAHSPALQPFIGFILLVTFLSTGNLILGS